MTEDYEHTPLDAAIFIVQSIFVLVVMLNLLIAIMQDTYRRVQQEQTIAFYREKAHLLQVLLSRIHIIQKLTAIS